MNSIELMLINALLPTVEGTLESAIATELEKVFKANPIEGKAALQAIKAAATAISPLETTGNLAPLFTALVTVLTSAVATAATAEGVTV